jgi:hypothetical protein
MKEKKKVTRRDQEKEQKKTKSKGGSLYGKITRSGKPQKEKKKSK